MVEVTINNKIYHVKTNWSEVDTDKLTNCQSYKDELICLTDIEPEIIEIATEVQLFPIYTIISFIDDIDFIEELQAIDVENASYQQLELTKKLIQTGKTYVRLLKAARVYYPDENNPVRLLGLGANIINQISVFLENYKEMISSEPEADEVWAGVDSLSDFGAWGTAYVLADRNILNLKSVLELPAIRVYEALRYNFRESNYMKRLVEIRHKPQ